MTSRRQRLAMDCCRLSSQKKIPKKYFLAPLIFILWDLRLLRDKPSAKGFTTGCGLLAPWEAVKAKPT